jgi:hypothetical protein
MLFQCFEQKLRNMCHYCDMIDLMVHEDLSYHAFGTLKSDNPHPVSPWMQSSCHIAKASILP